MQQGPRARYGAAAARLCAPSLAALLALAPLAARAQSNTCGGPNDEPCSEGEYCHQEPGVCRELGGQGACELRPDVCTQSYQPVCGCDGVTYSNACMAARAGVSVRADEACSDRT